MADFDEDVADLEALEAISADLTALDTAYDDAVTQQTEVSDEQDDGRWRRSRRGNHKCCRCGSAGLNFTLDAADLDGNSVKLRKHHGC